MSGSRRGRHAARAHRDAARLDEPAQRIRAAGVELRRHEPVRGLHDGALDIQALQRAGRFEAEQAPADHRAAQRPAEFGGAALDERPQGLDVVERAVDEAAGQVEAVHGQACRVRAGREDQRVPARC